MKCEEHMTPVPWPGRKIRCSTTPIKKSNLKKHRLNRTATYMDRIVKEAIEIQLHPGTSNREAAFIESCTWQTIISTLKRSTQPAITA